MVSSEEVIKIPCLKQRQTLQSKAPRLYPCIVDLLCKRGIVLVVVVLDGGLMVLLFLLLLL